MSSLSGTHPVYKPDLHPNDPRSAPISCFLAVASLELCALLSSGAFVSLPLYLMLFSQALEAGGSKDLVGRWDHGSKRGTNGFWLYFFGIASLYAVGSLKG